MTHPLRELLACALFLAFLALLALALSMAAAVMHDPAGSCSGRTPPVGGNGGSIPPTATRYLHDDFQMDRPGPPVWVLYNDAKSWEGLAVVYTYEKTTWDSLVAYSRRQGAIPVGWPARGSTPATSSITALYVYDLTAPAIEMPVEMALGAGTVWLGCEVKGATQTPYADLAGVTGAAGEKGQPQIHPIHRAGMTSLGLSFDREHDRVLYAIRLWERQGWQPWGCKP